MPVLSVIIPARNEEGHIERTLEAVFEAVGSLDTEVLVAVDSPDDPTAMALTFGPNVRLVVNTDRPGPASAFRAAVREARGDVVAVVMADLSDDVSQLPTLARLISDGAAVAVAARHLPGGGYMGASRRKQWASRVTGNLVRLAGIDVHDPTNAYKAYRTSFVRSVPVTTPSGFAFGLELVVRAHHAGESIVEIPTRWTERRQGPSSYRLAWLVEYLPWIARAHGRWVR